VQVLSEERTSGDSVQGGYWRKCGREYKPIETKGFTTMTEADLLSEFNQYLDHYIAQFGRTPDNFAALARWVAAGVDLHARMVRAGDLNDQAN